MVVVATNLSPSGAPFQLVLLVSFEQPRETLYRSLSDSGVACGADIYFTPFYQIPELIFNSHRSVLGHEFKDVCRIVDVSVLNTYIQVRQDFRSQLRL